LKEKKKIKVLRIINRFNIGGPTYNATFLTRFLSDEFETILVGGLPEKDEADSLHILEEYGVEAIFLPEMKRKPSFVSDRKALIKLKKIIQEFTVESSNYNYFIFAELAHSSSLSSCNLILMFTQINHFPFVSIQVINVKI
jgi:hypothetical protein